MASQSSLQKNDLSNYHEEVVRLLREGGTITSPPKRLRNAAEQLQKIGVIEVQYREFVLCANPRDRDFPPRNRSCSGRIYLQENFDEPGHDYRCQECERPVFPVRHNKTKFTEIRVSLCAKGIFKFIKSELDKLGVEVKNLADGVFHVAINDFGVIVCIVDFCTEQKYQSQAWAANHTTCYIAIGKRAAEERFLAEEWLVRCCLGDILCRTVDLRETIRSLASGNGPRAVLNASLPVYTPGPMPAIYEPLETAHTGRRFVVEVGENTVKVEGETVVAPQAGIRFEVFRILWASFLQDLQKARTLEDFHPMKLDDIAMEMENQNGKHIDDLTSIRRVINKLQSDIQSAVQKKIGMPIDREDIVQTCKQKGQTDDNYGYRINPVTVAAKVFYSPNS